MNTVWRPPEVTGVRKALLAWAADHLREFPWRDVGVSRYGVVIAEVLLKRTTAQAAARVYLAFIGRYPDFQSIWEAPVEEVEELLTPVGLYHQRAKGLKEMAEYLIRVHCGKIPDNLLDLVKVPHLGPYSARAVLSFGHGEPAAVVDSNVQRIFGRLYRGSLGDRPPLSAVQEVADLLLDTAEHRQFNWALLDLGALVCRYDRPRCSDCPLAGLCDYSKWCQEPGRVDTLTPSPLNRGQE